MRQARSRQSLARNEFVLIDEYLPAYDVASRHEVAIRASAEDAYAAILQCDLRASWISRMLFALRGLSNRTPRGPVLDGVRKHGFIDLGEDPPREILLGLVGRFWTARADLQSVRRSEFTSYAMPGFAKAVWNFTVSPWADGMVRVATQTRVLCLDDAARRKFKVYWTAIGPFSGVIRREMLKEIAHRASAPG